MNMKGGYKVEDYETLMDNQMKSQILPFVDKFKAAIDEYRVNYNSDNSLNKAKADSIGTVLSGGYYGFAAAAGMALGVLGTVLVTGLRKKKKGTQE